MIYYPPGQVAHAFFPEYGGDAHLDNEEFWTVDKFTVIISMVIIIIGRQRDTSPVTPDTWHVTRDTWVTAPPTVQGTNLLQVVTHELGHSLGLQHSAAPASMMAPFYRGTLSR